MRNREVAEVVSLALTSLIPKEARELCGVIFSRGTEGPNSPFYLGASLTKVKGYPPMQLHFPFSNMASRAGRRNWRLALDPARARDGPISAGSSGRASALLSASGSTRGGQPLATCFSHSSRPRRGEAGRRARGGPPQSLRPHNLFWARARGWFAGGPAQPREGQAPRERGREALTQGKVTSCPILPAGDEHAATARLPTICPLVRRNVSRRRPGPAGHLPPGP